VGFSGNSSARFAVICFALVVTIGLGYLKFVRGRRGGTARAAVEAGPQGGVIEGTELAELSARVATLEERAAAAASALGGGESEHRP
jgi:hypothetical protein